MAAPITYKRLVLSGDKAKATADEVKAKMALQMIFLENTGPHRPYLFPIWPASQKELPTPDLKHEDCFATKRATDPHGVILVTGLSHVDKINVRS